MGECLCCESARRASTLQPPSPIDDDNFYKQYDRHTQRAPRPRRVPLPEKNGFWIKAVDSFTLSGSIRPELNQPPLDTVFTWFVHHGYEIDKLLSRVGLGGMAFEPFRAFLLANGLPPTEAENSGFLTTLLSATSSDCQGVNEISFSDAHQ